MNGVSYNPKSVLEVFDEVPTENSKNLISSGVVYSAIASGGGSNLPDYSDAHPNYALLVNDETPPGIYWGEILPSYDPEIDNGKVLVVEGGGCGIPLSWKDPNGDILPSYGSGDENKCLMVYPAGCGVYLSWEALNGSIFPEYDIDTRSKVLTVAEDPEDPSSNVLIWEDPNGDILPEYTAYEDTKFLMVSNASGILHLRWEDPINIVLPEFTPEDANKALAVSPHGGTLEWTDIASIALPSYDPVYDEGKTLVINENGRPDWKSIIPPCTESDDGKVLSVDNCGLLNWIDYYPYVVGTTPPEDTRKLWIDVNNGLKYYNGSAWVTVPVAYHT